MTEHKTLITVPTAYYGGCPVCHRNNGIVQIYQGDWVVCHVHRTMWLVSASVWSTGTGYSKRQWAKIAGRFRHYDEVKPVCDPPTPIQESGIHCGLPDTVLEAVGRLVDYVWENESASYAKLTAAESSKHMFRSAAIVSGWLNGLDEPDPNDIGD